MSHVFSLQLCMLHFPLISPWPNHWFEMGFVIFPLPTFPSCISVSWIMRQNKVCLCVWRDLGSGCAQPWAKGEFPDAQDCYVMENCSNRVCTTKYSLSAKCWETLLNVNEPFTVLWKLKVHLRINYICRVRKKGV